MAKDIKLKIGADTADLERAFGNLIRKIQSDADKLKLTPTAAAGGGGKSAVQTNRDMERNLTKQKAELDMYNRSLEKRKAILDDIIKRESQGVTLTNERARAEDRLESARRIARIQQNNFDTSQQAARRSMGGSGGSGGGGIGNMPSGGITSLGGLAQFLGAPGMALGGTVTAMAALKAAESTRRFFSEAGMRNRSIEASAFQTQGQGGQILKSLFGGGAVETMLFSQQRQQASDIAKTTVEERYKNNVPSWAMALPGPIGGLVRGARGLMGEEGMGALEHFNLPQAARATAGRLFGSQTLKDEFQNRKNQEMVDIQAEQTEALKNGPAGAVRTAVADKFAKDWSRNLTYQRQMGQNETDFRNNLIAGNQAGFTDEQIMSSGSAIMGAGGSTRAARDNASFALKMARQYDLTNAGEAIGKISGQLGSSQLSKDALISIQAEGTRIGLNKADFVEENRKFVEMAAGVINQSNVTTTAGADQLTNMFSAFMGAKTISGLEAGKSAYESYKEQSQTQAGPSAVMRAAGMLKDPALRTMDVMQRSALFTMNAEDVNIDSPFIKSTANGNEAIKAAAAKAGKSPAQYLVDQYHGIQVQSLTPFAGFDEIIEKMKSYKGAEGNLAFERDMGEALKYLMPTEMGQKLGSQKSQMAFIRAMASGNMEEASKIANKGIVEGKVEGRETGRPGDEANRQMAEASRMANTLFMDLKTHIAPAVTETALFTAKVNELVTAMKSLDPAKIKAAQNALGSAAPGAAPTQTQAGPTGAGDANAAFGAAGM